MLSQWRNLWRETVAKTTCSSPFRLKHLYTTNMKGKKRISGDFFLFLFSSTQILNKSSVSLKPGGGLLLRLHLSPWPVHGEIQHLLSLDIRQTQREGFILNFLILSTHRFGVAFQTNSCINNTDRVIFKVFGILRWFFFSPWEQSWVIPFDGRGSIWRRFGKLFLWGKGAGRRSVSLYLSSYPWVRVRNQQTGSRCVTGEPDYIRQSEHD